MSEAWYKVIISTTTSQLKHDRNGSTVYENAAFSLSIYSCCTPSVADIVISLIEEVHKLFFFSSKYVTSDCVQSCDQL